VTLVVAVDLDGTILDARERQVALTAAILDELGMPPIDQDAFWERKRGGARTAEALVELGVPGNRASQVQSVWIERVERREWLELDAPLDGARDALAAMREDGAAPFVLTARRDAAAVAWQVERLGLGLDLEIVDPANAAAAKAEVLERRGAAGMIGDAESDAAAASAAGIPFVGVSSGQRSAEFLRAAGVDLVLPDLGVAWAALRQRLAAAP
jgi:phosphoglycolate phosphatase